MIYNSDNQISFTKEELKLLIEETARQAAEKAAEETIQKALSEFPQQAYTLIGRSVADKAFYLFALAIAAGYFLVEKSHFFKS